MRNPVSNDAPACGSNGGHLPKFSLPGGAAAVVVILAIAALVWKTHFSPSSGPTAQTSTEDAAAKAATRAMTFTQSPEPSK